MLMMMKLMEPFPVGTQTKPELQSDEMMIVAMLNVYMSVERRIAYFAAAVCHTKY